VVALFLILGSGVWIGLTLSGVAWIGMQLFSRARPATRWRSPSGARRQLDADRAAAVHLDGRDPVPHPAVARTCSAAWRPGCKALPGRLLHTNVVGCTIFAAVSGSSAATCATIGKMTLPELARRGYPDTSSSARWPAPARWAC
jgi:C4-dicarboxylate transporter DctM subunit